MKTLRYSLVATLVALFSVSVNAQSIYEMVQDGTYYTNQNYMWYDFKVSDDDPIGTVYSEYVIQESDASTANGWLQGWVNGGAGMGVSWDQQAGVLVSTGGEPTNDNGYTSIMMKPGTPKLYYNTQDFPYIAVKFKNLPICGEGGYQDGDELKEKMYGGTRLHVVEREQTAQSGVNSDFWLRIPRNQADADDMASRTNDFVEDWLTIYTPNDKDTLHIFNLQGAVMRNHGGYEISTNTAAVIDFYFIVCDALSATDYLTIEWVRSFYDAGEAEEYFDDWVLNNSSSVKNAPELAVDVISQDGKLVVSGVDFATIEVFNFTGQAVATTQGTEVSVAPGNYVVKVTNAEGSKVVKVVHN